jgi:hypothetical protein
MLPGQRDKANVSARPFRAQVGSCEGMEMRHGRWQLSEFNDVGLGWEVMRILDSGLQKLVWLLYGHVGSSGTLGILA